MKRQDLQNALDWFVPRNILRLTSMFKLQAVWFARTHRHVLRANATLKDRHLGQRCFILCNGPSVATQDITPLSNEIVFSVSNGYFHADYAKIRPRYHCVPQLTYATLGKDGAVSWFSEMNAKLLCQELFLDQQEHALVQRNALFADRNVKYVCMARNGFSGKLGPPDLTGIIPRVQTVPIMVLMIALYMGFREIYLIGTDHDWFVTKEYRYAFEPQSTKGMDIGVDCSGVLSTTLWDELPLIERVWSQYRALKLIAAAMGISIFNATNGGMLDEFPRVRLEDVFSGKQFCSPEDC